MAKMQMEVPNALLKRFEEIDSNYDEIFGQMVEESAEFVYGQILHNLGGVFKSTGSLTQGLKKTRVYKTPSDDGINTYVGFYGYNDEGVPIPLIAMAREYGTSRGEAKRPFLRKAFKKSTIEAIMKRVEERYFGGD